MKSLIPLLALILMTQNILGQSRNLRPGEPGKCYAKAYVDTKVIYDFSEETYPIFIGDKKEEIDFEYKSIMISPPSSNWKKCKDDHQGIGTNSRVWCLVEDPGETMEIAVVVDTSKTKEFIYETFEIYENVTLEDLENSSVWAEVICGNELSEKLIYSIQDALRDEGFYKNKNINYVTEELKSALINFQKSKELPFGQFDKVTLNALNIKDF